MTETPDETLARMAEEQDPWARRNDPGATIHQRLVAILDELPAIGKDQVNAQQKFMYRGHDDVMAALNPLLGKHGVYLVPQVVDRQTAQRTTGKGTVMYEVNLLVQFTFRGLADDFVTASAWGEGTDMGDKSTNKAMTMAFKNVLAVVFAISTHELSDADAGSPEETVPSGAVTAPAASREFDPGKDLRPDAPEGEGFKARIVEILTAAGPTVDWRETLKPAMHERFGVDYREDLVAEDVAESWRRTANFAASLAAAADLTAFPPVADRDPGVIVASLAWAFSVPAEKVEVVFQIPAEAIAGDDVPWVDDVQAALDTKAAAERDPDPPAEEAADADASA